ncbi:MAG: ribonuclease P protein component [Verrucomicrobiae bacterium]|nr:ribonuclease P protein component [Verrucomicrobiae bacterium]
MDVRFTFPKTERLHYGWQFRLVYERGLCARGRLLVLYGLVVPGEPRRVGIVASRRVGNAVARNRARRLLREAYRVNKHRLLPNLQMVLVARSAIVACKLSEVEADLLELCRNNGLLNTAQ